MGRCPSENIRTLFGDSPIQYSAQKPTTGRECTIFSRSVTTARCWSSGSRTCTKFGRDSSHAGFASSHAKFASSSCNTLCETATRICNEYRVFCHDGTVRCYAPQYCRYHIPYRVQCSFKMFEHNCSNSAVHMFEQRCSYVRTRTALFEHTLNEQTQTVHSLCSSSLELTQAE